MKKNKILFGVILVLFILIYEYFTICTDILDNKTIVNYIVIGFVIILGLYIIVLIGKSDNGKNTKFKDKLFNSLVENSNTIYIMLDAKTQKILYLSNNVESVLGINTKDKKEEDIVYELFNIDILKSEMSNWNKLSDYVSQIFKYDNPKYNHQMWLRIKIFPAKDKKEEYFIVEIIDATKEHEHQHLLVNQATDIKARERQLNQITALSYDVEININLVNNSYDLKYFKSDNMYFGEEKRGLYTEGLKEILNYINESDRQTVYQVLSIESLKQHFTKYELLNETVRYRLGDMVKNSTWLESTIFFLSSKQGDKVSILTKNVTENAESIRAQNVVLQNALNDAKMASKSKTELISTISHDIRTPLTNIIGLSDALIKENLNDSIKEDIKNINSSSKDVLNIIDGLLDISNIEKKIMKKNENQYSLLKMFKIIENSAKEYIGKKPIQLEINMNSNLPIVLYGDFKRITSAINEIVNNAIKYTEEGIISINVNGNKKNNNFNLLVEIKDTGVGIDSNKLNAIMKSKEDNTGIGSVKKLMDLLDGKLEIESKVSEYTKVTLSLIQKIVEDNKIRQMINNNSKTVEEFDLNNKKILVVDDNKLNLKVTSKLLSPFNVSVTLVDSGEECLELIKENNIFDLIMMDQMMPGMDGKATLEKLKEIKEFNTPVIALTADAIEGQKEKYLSIGFNDYISKPIDKRELSRILKEFLKKD